jgi:predicted DNA-binding protein (UPF0251 family)
MTQEQVAQKLGVCRKTVNIEERRALQKFADAVVALAKSDEKFLSMLQEAFRCSNSLIS